MLNWGMRHKYIVGRLPSFFIPMAKLRKIIDNA